MPSVRLKNAKAVLCCLALSGTLAAPQGLPRFDVISIRKNPDDTPGMTVRSMSNGYYSVVKAPLIALVTAAFQVSPERVIGLPAWPDRFDIEARVESPDRAVPVPATPQLLQSMLRDRFGMVAHIEKRDSPVYFLQAGRDAAQGGLQRSNVDCADPIALAEARKQNMRASNGAPACSVDENPGLLIAGGITMQTLASALRAAAGRPVIDRTGLSGTWQLRLEFAPVDDTSAGKPSIFTAIQDQLGLRLEPGRAPLDSIIIDRISRPSEN